MELPKYFCVVLVTLPLLWATSALGQSACCDNGWMKFQDSCYLFVDDVKDTFDQASEYCKARSSNLIEVESHSEDLFIKDILRRFTGNHDFWMGLTDEDIESVWRWSGSGRTVTYTDWAPGEPNSFQGRNEDCASYHGRQEYSWQDTGCGAHSGFICETSAA